MNGKKLLSLILAAVLLAGTLTACAPAQQPVTPAPPAAAGQQAPAAQAPAAGTPAAAPAEPQPVIGRGVTVAVAVETPSVTPGRHSNLNGSFKNELSHNGLLRLDPGTLTPIPDLATGWRALSDTQFEFTLREGVMFHNGDIMTADDVVASFEYQRTYPFGGANHLSVYSIEAIDTHTVLIDTGEPNAMLFADLTHHSNFIFPKSLIDAGYDFTINPVGTGPFVFSEWNHGNFLTYTRFDNYFDTERAANIEYVHWRFIPEGSSRTISLETGEIDLIMDVPSPDIPRLQENPNVTVFSTTGATFQYFMMNRERLSFDNVYLRRAIDMAMDREAMLMASLDGFGVPIHTAMPIIFPGASTAGTRAFDPEGARALIAEQGIDPAHLTFVINVVDEVQRRRAEVAQANLADVGITVSINQLEGATSTDLQRAGDFDSAFANLTFTNILSFYRSVYHHEGIGNLNRARVNDPELSALIDTAIATVDENARIAILEQISEIVNENVWLFGTNMNMLFRAFDANLTVPEISGIGNMNFHRVYWN